MIELLSRQTASAALAGCNLGHGVRSIVGNPDTSPIYVMAFGALKPYWALDSTETREPDETLNSETESPAPTVAPRFVTHTSLALEVIDVHDVESVLLALDESNEGACFASTSVSELDRSFATQT